MSSAKSKTLEPLQNLQSPDLMEERLSRLKAEFPDLFTNEGKLNPAELLRLTGEERREHFDFTWWGKAEAKQKAFTPTTAMLKYDPTRSVNPELAKGNCIIEGENLEVLKLLLFAYRGAVKCIYIDPPYNTGNDFVYSDKFAEGQRAYWEQTGITQDGVKTTTNTRTNGRFHSNWLNMIYPRLLVARQLLRDDGVIFVSIDDNEVANLRKVMDEVFGEESFVGQVIWQTATDNNPTQIGIEHEYILCYAKDLENQNSWELPTEKGKLIQEKYLDLKNKYGSNLEKIQVDLRAWIKSNRGELAGVAHYSYVDEKGVYYPGNSSNTKPGGYLYDIKHPVTKGVCAKPANGYRFPFETFKKAADSEDVEWGDDETTVPKIKKRLMTATEMLKSVYYEDNRSNTAELKKIFDGNKVFDNPKSVSLLKYLFRFMLQSEYDLLLDFYGGSGSTGHAVLELNREDGVCRPFILVQIPEITSEKSVANKSGYRKISDITVQRVRRVIDGYGNDPKPISAGFKVFKLEKSVFPRNEFTPDPNMSFEQNILELKGFIDQKEKSLFDTQLPEDVRDEVLLKCGFKLDVELEPISEVADNTVYLVRDNRGVSSEAIVCFDTNLSPKTLGWLGQQSQARIIILEAALDTSIKWNLANKASQKIICF